jgi:hypothetical protein
MQSISLASLARIVIMALGCALGCALAACSWMDGPPPVPTEIESIGMLALHGQRLDAVRKLKHWADSGSAVAQRELGLFYASAPNGQAEAVKLLTKAAEGGDMQAQYHVGKALQEGKLGLKPDYPQAWKWLEASAKQGLGKASYLLARMAKYGQGVPLSLELSVHWLQEGSKQRDPQAMYLLSNAYASGEGISRNMMLARYWLTMSAESDYNVAIQALAMELDGLGGTESPFAQRSRQLFKEAKDHRLMRWNTLQ